MRCTDYCTITRTSTVKDPKTHIASTQTVALTPFKCRLGKSSGTLIQGTPQGTVEKQIKLYVPNVKVDIKSGDIAVIGTSKYIVGHIYAPNRHHLEVDVTYKEEV